MSRECDIKFKVKQEYLMHMKDHEEVNQSGGKLANLIFTSQKDISNHVVAVLPKEYCLSND